MNNHQGGDILDELVTKLGERGDEIRHRCKSTVHSDKTGQEELICSTTSLLQDAVTFLEKAEGEEKILWSSAGALIRKDGGLEKEKQVEKRGRPPHPPPPILLARSNHSVFFTPGPYVLEQQVSSVRDVFRDGPLWKGPVQH